jgi:hypothetical protein
MSEYPQNVDFSVYRLNDINDNNTAPENSGLKSLMVQTRAPQPLSCHVSWYEALERKDGKGWDIISFHYNTTPQPFSPPNGSCFVDSFTSDESLPLFTRICERHLERGEAEDEIHSYNDSLRRVVRSTSHPHPSPA